MEEDMELNLWSMCPACGTWKFWGTERYPRIRSWFFALRHGRCNDE